VQQTADIKQLPQRKNTSPNTRHRGAIKTDTNNTSPRLTPTIQTFTEKFQVDGMGSNKWSPSHVTIKAHGNAKAASPPSPDFFSFANGRVEQVILPEEAYTGWVKLTFSEEVKSKNLFGNDESQHGNWYGTVPFTVIGNQIAFGEVIENMTTEGVGASMSVKVGSGPTPVGGYVTFNLTVNSTASKSMEDNPTGTNRTESTSSALAGSITRSFVVNLVNPPPRPTPPIVGPEIPFRVNSSRLKEGQDESVSQWFNSLPEDSQDAIRNGRRVISISGYASTTGRRGRNRTLSEQRAHAVERILRGHTGSNALISIYFFGEDNATTLNQVEDEKGRRATIVVQAPNHTAPQLPGLSGK
jgi:outer membrane protein OmpA-like peptidoglycan-associated protein